MKKLIGGLILVSVAMAQQVPILLPNGWLSGTVIPSSCSSGVSPDFYYVNSQALYTCLGNIYVANATGSTIAHTTSTLKGDGSGNAVAVTGTGTNCVLVNGSSGACGSGSGTVTTTGSPSSGQIGKFSGATSITNAVAGTDYVGPTSGSALQKASSGGLTAASGSDVVGLFTSCVGSRYLGADGACHVVPVGAIVGTGQDNVYTTGLQDFGLATGFRFPTGAGLTATTNLMLAYNTTDGFDYLWYSGASHKIGTAAFSDTGAFAPATATTSPLKGNGSGGTAAATSADIINLFSTCSGVQYLGADGACHNAGGGSGTVTVVGAGSLTSTALVTGGGTTTLQTPSATATMDSSGNISTPGTLSVGAGGAGTITGGTGSTPSAPSAGNVRCGFSTTTPNTEVCIDSSSNVTEMIQGIANPSDTQVVNYVDASGVQHRIAQSGGGGSVFTGSTATNPAFSATPTFSLADVSVKSPVRVEPGAMTANVTAVTFTNKTAGAKFSIVWLQDGTGGRTLPATNWGGTLANTPCSISLLANAWTEHFFEVSADGSTTTAVGCSSSDPALSLPAIAFSSLGSRPNGSIAYCSDCTVTSGVDNTCATSGTGSFATRLNGAWKCFQ